MESENLVGLHWLMLWEWTRAWKHWSKYIGKKLVPHYMLLTLSPELIKLHLSCIHWMWSKCTNIFDLYSGIPQKQPEITINFSSTLHTADSELGYKSRSCWIDSDQCWHWDEENFDSLRWNWKVRQLPGIKPKYLACADSGLPLSCDNQTTTNTHNLLYVLHRSHTWQPLS